MNEVDKFLQNFTSKNTVRCYRSALKDYFSTIDKKPEGYFKDKRDYENDVITYWKKLQAKAPITRRTRMSAVKIFLEENNIEILSKTWKKLSKRSKGKRAITIDRILTVTQLKQILQHGDPMTRAVTLIACSSGMRIGEILSILPSDIDYSSKPTKIKIRGEITKTGDSRITFISSEATSAIEAWLQIRDEWFKTAIGKTNGVCKKKTVDERLFPISYTVYDRKWIRLLKKSHLNERDSSSKYHVYHFHTLRKFFETRMSYSGCPEAIYQELEGHTGYLNGAYKRYTEDELKEWYLKGLQQLLVFETQPDISQHTKEIDQLREDKVQMQSTIDEMKAQIMELMIKILTEKNGDKILELKKGIK